MSDMSVSGLTWQTYPATRKGKERAGGLPHDKNRMKTWGYANEQFIERLSKMFDVTNVPGDGFCVWHAVAESLRIDAKTLREGVLNHMAERSDLYSQFIVGYNTTKYENLLNNLNRQEGWNTEMGDMVLAGIATHLGRVIVVYTIHHPIIVSPLDGKVDERLSLLLVAYVRNSHFMHVKPKSQLQQFGESAEAEGMPQRPHTDPVRRPSIGVGTDWGQSRESMEFSETFIQNIQKAVAEQPLMLHQKFEVIRLKNLQIVDSRGFAHEKDAYLHFEREREKSNYAPEENDGSSQEVDVILSVDGDSE